MTNIHIPIFGIVLEEHSGCTIVQTFGLTFALYSFMFAFLVLRCHDWCAGRFETCSVVASRDCETYKRDTRALDELYLRELNQTPLPRELNQTLKPVQFECIPTSH